MDEEPVQDIYHATSSSIPSTSVVPIKSQTMVMRISASPENLRRSTASATIRRLPPPTDSLERYPPKASPKMTTFALPPVTEASNLGYPFSTSPPPHNTSSHPIQRSNSIFGKLSRKLSQSKTANGRGSLSSKNSAATAAATAAAAAASMVESNHSERTAPQDQTAALPSSLTEISQAAKGLEVPSGQTTLERKGSGLKRGLRALGRSKSEGRRGDGWKSPARIRAEGREKVENAGVETKSIEQSSTGELFWEERLGICWDGREQVHPDFTYNPNPAVQTYSSNADFLPNSAHRRSYCHHTDSGGVAPPSRVVYASTLSTFPPRPPLKSKLTTSPPSSPVIQMTPASQVIADYFAACRDREESERKMIEGSVYRCSTPPSTTSASASQSLTPIPSTPQLLRQTSLDVMSPITTTTATTTTTTTTAAATMNTTLAASVSVASIYSDATSKSSVSRSTPPSEEEMGRRRRFGRNSEESDTSLESMRERESSSEQERQTKEGAEEPIVEGGARDLPAVLSVSSDARPAFPLRQTSAPLSAKVPSTAASAVATAPRSAASPDALPPLAPIDIPIKNTSRSPASSERQGNFIRHERTPSSGSNFSAFGHPGGATGVYASRTPPTRSPPSTPSTPPATTTTTTMSKRTRTSPVIRSRGKLSSSPFTTITSTTTMTTIATATARFALVDEGSATNNTAMSSSSLSSPRSPCSSQGPSVSDGGTVNLATSPVSPSTSNITLQPTSATPSTSSVPPILKAPPSAAEALSTSISPPLPPQAVTTSTNVPQWRTTLTTFTIPPVQAATTNFTKTTESEIDSTASPIINTTMKPLRTPVKDFIDREYLHDERDEEDECSSVETGDWRDCSE